MSQDNSNSSEQKFVNEPEAQAGNTLLVPQMELRECPFCGTTAWERYSARYWQHPTGPCIMAGTVIFSPETWNTRATFTAEDDELHEIIPIQWKHEVIELLPPLPKKWSASVWGEGFQVFGESAVSPTVALCKAIVAAFKNLHLSENATKSDNAAGVSTPNPTPSLEPTAPNADKAEEHDSRERLYAALQMFIDMQTAWSRGEMTLVNFERLKSVYEGILQARLTAETPESASCNRSVLDQPKLEAGEMWKLKREKGNPGAADWGEITFGNGKTHMLLWRDANIIHNAHNVSLARIAAKREPKSASCNRSVQGQGE